MTTILGYLLYVGIAILALLIMREFRFAMNSIRAQRWRRAEGQLVEPDLRSSRSFEGSKTVARRIDYEYSVEANHYRSDRIGFGFPDKVASWLARGALNSVLQNAPNIMVYYDPRQPQNSVLVSGFQLFHGLKVSAYFVALVFLYVLSFGL